MARLLGDRPLVSSLARALVLASFAASLPLLGGCKNDKKEDRAPPPPALEKPKPGACAEGGGKADDPVQGEFLPRTVADYCLDPQGDTRTYGDRGKLTMDQVCTTAVNGECEVYKSYGLKRTVIVRYVDGAGTGSSVEIILSTFADAPGAFGMYTKRVVADADPADPSAPRPLTGVTGAGALGSGRGYIWKGPYFVEFQYLNEQESPDQLTKSGARIITLLAQAIDPKLPSSPDKPAAVELLPANGLVANGVQYFPKDVLGVEKLGPGAVGYYKEGEKRYRFVTLAREDADGAKDAMKVIRKLSGASAVQQLGDEAAHVVVQDGPDRPKVEYVAARKGSSVFAVGDEEFVLDAGEPLEKQGDRRLSKDEKIAQLRAVLLATKADAGAAPTGDAGKKP